MLSIKSTEVIVSYAFKETFIKLWQVTADFYCKITAWKKRGQGAENSRETKAAGTIGSCIFKEKIVGVKKGSNVQSLTQNCVKLIGNY